MSPRLKRRLLWTLLPILLLVAFAGAWYLWNQPPPDMPAGKEAYRQLAQQIESADVGNLAAAFDLSRGQSQTIPRLAPTLLARVKQAPDHPRAARLLAEVCVMTNPRDEEEPPALYQEAADLIASRYADSPDIYH